MNFLQDINTRMPCNLWHISYRIIPHGWMVLLPILRWYAPSNILTFLWLIILQGWTRCIYSTTFGSIPCSRKRARPDQRVILPKRDRIYSWWLYLNEHYSPVSESEPNSSLGISCWKAHARCQYDISVRPLRILGLEHLNATFTQYHGEPAARPWTHIWYNSLSRSCKTMPTSHSPRHDNSSVGQDWNLRRARNGNLAHGL